MSSVIPLNQIDGSELWKKVGFKPSEKVLVALRGVYNLPFNLDDPVEYLNLLPWRLVATSQFVWKCDNDNEDNMDKNGLPWEENDYVKMNICVQINGLKMQ